MSGSKSKAPNLGPLPMSLETNFGKREKLTLESLSSDKSEDGQDERSMRMYPRPPEEAGDVRKALSALLHTLEGKRGFVFWSHCFRSVFMLSRAPKQGPSILLEALILTDTDAPVLLVVTRSRPRDGDCSVPDLTSYRVALAKVLYSKIQYFTSDLVCVLSAVVDVADMKGLKEHLAKTYERGKRFTSPIRLMMSEGKLKSLEQATLAAIAVTTVPSKLCGKEFLTDRAEKHSFFLKDQIKVLVEHEHVAVPIFVKGGEEADKTLLAVEIAWRHSLSKHTLFVSFTPLEQDHPARKPGTGLQTALLSEEAPLEKGFICVVVDDFKKLFSNHRLHPSWPSFLRNIASKHSAKLLCFGDVASSEVERLLGSPVHTYVLAHPVLFYTSQIGMPNQKTELHKPARICCEAELPAHSGDISGNCIKEEFFEPSPSGTDELLRGIQEVRSKIEESLARASAPPRYQKEVMAILNESQKEKKRGALVTESRHVPCHEHDDSDRSSSHGSPGLHNLPASKTCNRKWMVLESGPAMVPPYPTKIDPFGTASLPAGYNYMLVN